MPGPDPATEVTQPIPYPSDRPVPQDEPGSAERRHQVRS